MTAPAPAWNTRAPAVPGGLDAARERAIASLGLLRLLGMSDEEIVGTADATLAAVFRREG